MGPWYTTVIVVSGVLIITITFILVRASKEELEKIFEE
jgi:hypothetical protein